MKIKQYLVVIQNAIMIYGIYLNPLNMNYFFYVIFKFNILIFNSYYSNLKK